MENRAQSLCWTELVELKVGCDYVRRYRDALNDTLTRFAAARGVVSVAASPYPPGATGDDKG